MTRNRILIAATTLGFAMALLAPSAALAKKKDYSGKSYGGKTIEEYCCELLGVEVFDLTDEDLEECDRNYDEQVEGLGDLKMGDLDLGTGTRAAASD